MGENLMEKKKNKKAYQKQRYSNVLKACAAIDSMEFPLVNNIIYNLNNINIPKWKNLTKVQKVAFFSVYIVDENWAAITLRFSFRFIENCSQVHKVTDFIRRRVNENFKNRLNYVPEYLFCIEFEKDNFHIHGVIKPENNLEIIKKILKTTAFGRNYTQNNMPESSKIKCDYIYNGSKWGNYILKSCTKENFDIYICLPVIRKIFQK